MALSHSPQIVRDGLVLYLDAANIKSYPGTGTNWANLSSNNFNATMHGSVPFTTDITKCFDFSTATGGATANASLGFTFTNNMIPTTGNFTLSFWLKNLNSSSGQVGLFSNAGGGDGYRFGVGLNGIYYLIGPTYKEGTINFLSSISATLWSNVTVVFSRTTLEILLYLNGQYQGMTTLSAPQNAFTNTAPGIVRNPCCTIYTGKISNISAYNRGLSANEIKKNFEALRGRHLI
jgi:hypothetical protein